MQTDPQAKKHANLHSIDVEHILDGVPSFQLVPMKSRACLLTSLLFQIQQKRQLKVQQSHLRHQKNMCSLTKHIAGVDTY